MQYGDRPGYQALRRAFYHKGPLVDELYGFLHVRSITLPSTPYDKSLYEVAPSMVLEDFWQQVILEKQVWKQVQMDFGVEIPHWQNYSALFNDEAMKRMMAMNMMAAEGWPVTISNWEEPRTWVQRIIKVAASGDDGAPFVYVAPTLSKDDTREVTGRFLDRYGRKGRFLDRYGCRDAALLKAAVDASAVGDDGGGQEEEMVVIPIKTPAGTVEVGPMSLSSLGWDLQEAFHAKSGIPRGIGFLSNRHKPGAIPMPFTWFRTLAHRWMQDGRLDVHWA